MSATALSLKDAEKLMAQAAGKAEARDFSTAFELYVKAAQTFLHINRTLSTSTGGLTEREVAYLKTRCKESGSKALKRAEMIKRANDANLRVGTSLDESHSNQSLRPVVRDRLSHEEQFSVVGDSSRVNGIKFLPWTEPDEATFETVVPFSDPMGQPPLAQSQEAKGAEWKRLQAVFDVDVLQMTSPNLLVEDIVQGVVTNCSLVAGLEVCWDHHQRFGSKLALSSLYPQDGQMDPTLSSNGKYCAKMWFNGADRMVVVDDKLPVDSSGSLICASGQMGKVLWPSLIEKAYMKIMGGYDFPGSNSSIDLHVLTKWIPEYIALRSGSFQREKIWRTMLEGFTNGQCLVTVGTGTEVTQAIPHLNFVRSHNYAITGVEEIGTSRKLKIINPWRRQFLGTASADYVWTDWETVCDVFEGIYLNWDPRIFDNTKVFHGSWPSSEVLKPLSNYQLRLSFLWQSDMQIASCEVWILLTQHVVSKHQKKQFMALVVSQMQSDVDRSEVTQGAYSNSPHILTKATIKRGDDALFIVASRDIGPEEDENATQSHGRFTITIYSPVPCELEDPLHGFTYTKKVQGNFTPKNSGGNATFRTFMNNPQYQLRILTPPTGQTKPKDAVPLRFLLEGSRHTPINIKLVWSNGKRVTELRRGDVIVDSGAYTYGTASADSQLPAGTYTLILSTFEPKQQLPYTLSILSAVPVELEAISQEGAGMFLKSIKGGWSGVSAAGNPIYGKYLNNPKYTIKVSAMTKIICRLQLIQASPRAALGLGLFEYSSYGTLGRKIVDSGPYTEDICGTRTDPITLPGPASYILIPSTFEANMETSFELLVYSSAGPVEVGTIDEIGLTPV